VPQSERNEPGAPAPPPPADPDDIRPGEDLDAYTARLAAGHRRGRRSPSGNAAHHVTAVSVTLSTVTAKPVSWLWPGRIPLGKVTMLDGDPGLGKSTLALDVAARVTTARRFPDGAPGVAGGVVLLTAEDGLADTVRPRLDAMAGDPSRVVALTAVADEDGQINPITLPDHIPALRTAIEQVRARLVIIDPYVAYLASYVNSRIDHDIRRTLAPLTGLAEETGAALLLIRHLNKASGGPALYRGGGSIGLIAAVRSGLLVAEDPDDPTRRVLAVVKANLAPRAPSLAYRLESATIGVARIVWAGESPHSATALLAVPENTTDRSALDDAKRWLADFLADGAKQPAQVFAVSRKAGHASRTIERAKAQLGVRSEKRGPSGSWIWSLPEGRLSPSLGGLATMAPGSLNGENDLGQDRQDRQPGEGRQLAVFADPDAVARDAMREGA
jgi:AAA domain-containing protein